MITFLSSVATKYRVIQSFQIDQYLMQSNKAVADFFQTPRWRIFVLNACFYKNVISSEGQPQKNAFVSGLLRRGEFFFSK